LQPNRGAFVHVPRCQRTKDVYELRIALEEMVMDMLLDLPDLPRACNRFMKCSKKKKPHSSRATA
jgi:DNA-binding GntR family transcriptional regulator